ncbi:TonB-dependent receptor plug domain-containing protein [Novosphingobium profundi]|uniref:TonB-dependent receptor plug domain-containing protein n=1 Tax=Novosphingobium profundi TaxID=1774954 RepID=UPI001BD94277|nr:TonB-dependent receptor plug domain-containing protein [Novosphingobium profundi]MBT0669355.1 TonB-dependent receptor plug domain-containing protein [Novosphingobium profundi]
MGRTLSRLLLATALSTNTTIAMAQEVTEQVLPEIRAEGDRADESYVMGAGNDAGTTTITAKEIRARAPGSGDANQLLKALPSVQFSRDEGLATREDIQDIRPADISISGGRFYENLITIDGIDANSRLDITQDSPAHYAEPAGASAQALWVDANLVGAITLRDANVSAEYGRFTGGALDIQTRAPKRSWGGSATVSYTSDALTNFKISQGSRATIDEGDMPGTPSFEKWRYGASLDAPISQDVGLLLAYNRSRSQVVYTRGSNYGERPYTQSSTSDNFLAKLEADLASDLTLTGQFSYTPYESEYASANGVQNELVTKGGGITSQVKLARSGETEWSIAASLSHSDTSRDAQETNYSIPSFTTNGNVCSASNCTIGGFGDVDQWQDNYALTGRWSAPVGPGRLSAGFDYQRIEAMRSRPEDTYAYSRGTDEEDAASIVCAQGDSMTCVTGEYALQQYSLYKAYRAKVGLDSLAAWTQYELELGDMALRGGLRYDWESFLGNHTVSPRLSASYALPWSGWSVTLGANRYYGRSMLAYALREQYPDNLTYRRTGTASGDSLVYSDADWTLYSTSHSTSYSDGNKKTPYSDELSAAMSGRILGGALRVKGTYRKGRNEFTRSEGETETTTLIDGTSDEYTNYVITNDGHSTYRGLSLEYTRSFGKHALAFSTNFSKTKTSNDDYLTTIDEDTDYVVFEDQVISLAELEARNQREDMASPFIANLTWTALWLDDRITTNVNLRYRGSFDQIEDTGESATVEGTNYDLYDYVHYPKALDVNLNAQAELVRSSYGVLTGDVRVANLLDRTPSPNSTATSQPYQYGRSFWFGLNYRF